MRKIGSIQKITQNEKKCSGNPMRQKSDRKTNFIAISETYK